MRAYAFTMMIRIAGTMKRIPSIYFPKAKPKTFLVLNFLGGTGTGLHGSHGLSARRAQRTKSRGPKGLQVEVGARRAPKLLVVNKRIHVIVNSTKEF